MPSPDTLLEAAPAVPVRAAADVGTATALPAVLAATPHAASEPSPEPLPGAATEPEPEPASDADTPAVPARSLHDEALAHALVWLTRHHGRERSIDALFANLPVQDGLPPELAVRALREDGYQVTLLERSVSDLHELLLPAVVLLKNGGAWIITGRRAGSDSHFDLVIPGRVALQAVATADEIASEHNGLVMVAVPAASADGAALLANDGSHWLWGTMRRFVPYYRSALLAALLSNVLMLVTGIIASVVYDKVIPHHAFVTLWTLAAAGAMALAFDLTARLLRAHLIDVAGRKADLIIGSALFRHTLGIRMEHRPDSSGAYAHQLAQVELVREFFASASLATLSDVPFVALFVAMAFVIGGPLGWVLVVAIPLILLIATVIQGALRRAMAANMQQHADLHGVLVEAVDGMEDLKAAGAQGRFVRHYEQTTAAAADSALRSRRISSWVMSLSGMWQQIVTLCMLVLGVYLIDAKVITGGAMIGAVMFSSRAIAPLQSVVMLAMRYQGARAAMQSLNIIMAQPVERDAARGYVPRLEFSGRIGLQQVAFAYPHEGGAGPRVLNGVNLRFGAGERVAILGRIGSGKSTVLRLLAGLYLPIEGMVEADGIDLRQIDPADYRARVGFVSQDPRLFSGTLRENVLLDRPAADPARLSDVAALTGLDRLVAAHPLGWELPVGEAGALLSGGQRQLVALARCLVTRPRILLMDEPTSSMDAQSEVAFLKRLKAAAGDCTLVMVTHRPAVLDLVSRVVVVDAGRVVMDGPRDRVLAALSSKA
jgi:ATP-binding cassette, subfamily C, bacterial LapB